MEWSKADIVWNEETYPGLNKSMEGVLPDADVAIEGSWVHIRRQETQSVTSYPSRVVFRINWHQEPASG